MAFRGTLPLLASSGSMYLIRYKKGFWVNQGHTAEKWRVLCGQAAREQDPAKLLQLVQEINRLLAEKEERLQKQARGTSS